MATKLSTERKAETNIIGAPALVSGQKIQAIVPHSYGECVEMAKAIMASGLCPDSYTRNTKADQVVGRITIAIMRGMEIGMPALMALESMYIINNKATLYGDAAVALIQRSGLLEGMTTVFDGEEGKPGWKCTVTMKRKGQDEPYVSTFTWEDAVKANLANKSGPWKQYPKRMLMNRARAFCMRNGFADCLSGLSIYEEEQDIVKEEVTDTPDISSLADDPRDITDEVTEIETATAPTEAESADEDRISSTADAGGEAVVSSPPKNTVMDWQPICDGVVKALDEANNGFELEERITSRRDTVNKMPAEMKKVCKEAAARNRKRFEE